MNSLPQQQILGVLGGMGPLASAEFMKTIYEHNLGDVEQLSPPVILYSDPTFPDRTTAFLNQETAPMLAQLELALGRLAAMGVAKIVICCMTIHYLVPQLPDPLQDLLIPLPDVIISELQQVRGRHLLLCTRGTSKLEIIQRHPRWKQVAEYVVLPDERDQELIHEAIYGVIKRNGNVRDLHGFVYELLEKYHVASFVAGCTEMHILSRSFALPGKEKGCRFIDPLTIIAERIVPNLFLCSISNSMEKLHAIS
jgi:aspartate racemase